MRVSYVEGIANHNPPESCGAAREGGVEALTRDADAVEESGRHHRVHRHRKVCPDLARSETPCRYGGTLCGNREIPRLSAEKRTADRIGKSKDSAKPWVICGGRGCAVAVRVTICRGAA
jgi:hypothetical protein